MASPKLHAWRILTPNGDVVARGNSGREPDFPPAEIQHHNEAEEQLKDLVQCAESRIVDVHLPHTNLMGSLKHGVL